MEKYNLFDIANPKQWKTISSEDFDPKGKYYVYGANGIIGKTNSFNHKEETVLITCRGATCGTVNLSQPFSYINGNAMALDDLDRSKAITKYVYYFFQNYNFQNVITGSAQPQITREGLKNVEISLPNLETQNKIVAILDKAKAILDKREETLKKYDELLRATFLDMFGDPFKPKSNTFIPFKKMITDIESGWSPVCQEIPRSSSSQVAVLKQGAVSKRYFQPDENKLLPLGLTIKKAVYARKNNLLFSRKNTPELVGSTVYLFDDYENLLLPDTIFNIRYDDSMVSGVYLFYLFNNVEFRKKINRLSVGQAESMSNISQARLLQLEIPLPELEEQRRFENIVIKSQNSIFRNLQKSKNALDTLLKSLSQQVFNQKIIIDIDAELEALINAINVDNRDEDNKIDTVVNDITFVQRLIDRLANQEFESIDQYDKAKYILFRIMKEEEILVKQVFDGKIIQLTLKNETA